MAIPFTPEDFESPMNGPAPGQPPADIIDQMAQVREEQAKSLDEHMQYRAGLEEKQQQVDLRRGDLDVSERLLKVFDTTLPKPFREFELRGLSRHLGIDPKGDNFKEISKVVMGLDPDSSQAVREAFTARMSEATPGQVSEFTRGILQGKVPISQLAGMVQEHQVAQQGKIEGLFSRQAKEFKPNDVVPAARGDAAQAGAQAGMAGSGDGQGGIKGAFAGGRESKNTTMQQNPPDNLAPQTDPNTIVVEGPPPTDNRVVDPSIAAALGYDANKTPSAEILARHPGIGGMDPKDQREAAKKLAENRQYTQETIRLADRLNAIVDTDPNTIPYTMPIIGKWVGTNLNAAKELTSLEDARNSLRKALFPEGIYEYYKKHQIGKTDEETRETAKKAQEVFNSLFALAYMSAKAKDPSGRLSDQDIQMELRGLGADSGSRDVFKAALKNHVEVTIDRYGTKIQAETGGPAVDIKANGAVIQRQGADPAASTPAAGQPAGQTAPTQTPAATPATPQQKTEAQTPTQQAQTARTKEQAKDADLEVQQRQRAFDLEQAPKIAQQRLEAAQRDEARLQLAMDAAKEAREWKEYQKLKDAKAEARREKEKISAAFAQFARALSSGRGGVSMGGSPSMGADQDAGAFKIAPGSGSKRAPPQPGEAKSGYTYTRKRREMTGGG